MPMKLVMMGTGPFAVPTLRALAAAGHDLAQVVCRPPHGKRGEPPAPVRLAAESLGLPVWMPPTVNSADSQSRLRELQADLLLVCDYGEILRDATLQTARLGGVNLHGSLLPRHRGAAPVQWAVIRGDAETGATVIHMTPGLDAGPVLGTVATPIDPEETAGELEDRLAELGAPLAVRVVEQLAAGGPRGRPQDKSLVTKAPRLAKADGLVDWSLAAPSIKNRVRGLQPWPRTYTFYRDAKGRPQRLNIDRVAVTTGSGAPGAILEAGQRLVVATGGDALEVLELQPAGKRRMRAADWLRGAPLGVGDAFLASSD
ncbi:MAG: methionyl-tRNA formyltransferase [Planctomycetota bacterium]